MLRVLGKLDWKYVVSETVIVAIGVAMALTADAWWEDRSDRTAEATYLQGLGEEFASTALDLVEEGESAVERIAAIDELLALMSSERIEAPLEVLERLSIAFQTSVLRPVTATYDDLVTSGSTGILRSNDLRIALAEWSAHLEIHRRLEDYILAPHYLATDDFMMRNLAVSALMGPNAAPEAPFELDVPQLLADRDLWNLLVVRRNWIGNRQLSLEELRKRLHRVQVLLGVDSDASE